MVRRWRAKQCFGILAGVALMASFYLFLSSSETTSTNVVVGRRDTLAFKPPLLSENQNTTVTGQIQNDLVWLPSFNSSYDTDKCRMALKIYTLLAKEAKKQPRGENYVNCQNVFDVVRFCFEFSGLKPLPNFYLREKQGPENFTDKDYLRAHLGFIHVPKAGGTSVETFLMESKVRPVTKEPVTTFRLAHCGDFLNALKKITSISTPIMFYSKRSFGIHYYSPTVRTFMYATWFREPVSRFLSTFYYQRTKRWGGQPLTSKYVYRSKNLAQFLNKTRNVQMPDYDNFMVRLLQFGNFPEIDNHFEDCCGSSSQDIGKVEEKHYLIAKRNLQLMAFIGLTEDFKVSQDMFLNILGQKPATEVVHINSNPHSSNITDWERAEIEKKVFWDIKLYQDAKQIFEKQKEEYLQNQLSRVLEALH